MINELEMKYPNLTTRADKEGDVTALRPPCMY